MLALVVVLGSCTSANQVSPVVPKITFTSLVRATPRSGYNANEVQRSLSSTEGLILTIEFEDGDGDIGGATSNTSDFADFFVEDIRPDAAGNRLPVYPYRVPGDSTDLTAFQNNGKIPSLDSDTRTPSIQGTLRLRIGNLEALPLDTCSLTPSAAGFRQRAFFKVYLLDRAGNKSNEINTTDVFIRCE